MMRSFAWLSIHFWILVSGLGAISACSKSPTPVRTKTHVDQISPTPVTQRDELPSNSNKKSQASRPATATTRLAPRQMQRLASEGQLDATMMVPSPLGSSGLTRQRVMFAAHGAGGRGEDHCEHWDRLVAGDVIIVCPTGTLLRKNDEQGGAYFQSHLTLRKELDALISAVRRHFKGRLSDADWLYLGYSQGATMGALALLENPAVAGKNGFSQLVLVEGGAENWNLSRSKKFKDAGGLGVFLVCGTAGCGRHGQGNIPHLKNAGLTASLIEVEGGGHAYWGPMTEGVRSALSQAGYAK